MKLIHYCCRRALVDGVVALGLLQARQEPSLLNPGDVSFEASDLNCSLMRLSGASTPSRFKWGTSVKDIFNAIHEGCEHCRRTVVGRTHLNADR